MESACKRPPMSVHVGTPLRCTMIHILLGGRQQTNGPVDMEALRKKCLPHPKPSLNNIYPTQTIAGIFDTQCEMSAMAPVLVDALCNEKLRS